MSTIGSRTKEHSPAGPGKRYRKGTTMGTLIAAYFIAWAAVSAYVGRLVVLGRRLTRRMNDLQSREHEHSVVNAR